MINWHGCMPAGIDTETSGLDPDWHEVIQIAIQPAADDLTPHPTHRPFDELVRPRHPERWDKEAEAIHGITLEQAMAAPPAETVIEWLDEWFASLDLAEGKRLVPIAHNWPYEHDFLGGWLGQQHRDQLFHYHYRCTVAACGLLRDKNVPGFAGDNGVSLKLTSLCQRFGIPLEHAHKALPDAQACLELYRRLVI